MTGPGLPLTGTPRNVAQSNTLHALFNNFDVNIAGAVVGQVLLWDGSAWVPGYSSEVPVEPGSDDTVRDATLQPFLSSSPFNTSLGSGAIYADDAMAASVRLRSAAFQSDRWSISIARAATSDPFAQIDVANGSYFVNCYIPVGAQPAAGTDMHLSIIQPDGQTNIECFTMTRIDDTHWTSGYVVTTDLKGTGLVNGARASGISQVNGLIRKHEVLASSTNRYAIPHALSLALDDSQLLSVGPDSSGNYGVWPARRQDGDGTTAYSGVVPMGSMFAIPTSVDVTGLGLSAEGLALATAMQDYGMYVVIRGSTVATHAEAAAEAQYPTQVANMRAAWVNTLRPLLVHITNQSASNVAGGGTRRRADAAPLA